jgi:hypothetical protein
LPGLAGSRLVTILEAENFFFKKLEYGYQNKPEIYLDFETVEKIRKMCFLANTLF